MVTPEIVQRILKTLQPSFFLLIIVVFTIFTAILEFHWHKYGIQKRIVYINRFFYYGISIILFWIMLTTLLFS